VTLLVLTFLYCLTISRSVSL